MKKYFLNFIVVGLMLSFVFVGCQKNNDDDNNEPNDIDNPDNPVPDPEGTVTFNMAQMGSTDYSYISVLFNGGTIGFIWWSKPDNISIRGDYWQPSICSLGALKGLGNITSIPTSGFNVPTSPYSVACEVGHGYVIKYENDTQVIYVRLYVVESIVSTSGGIMGAKVKYQYPFVP